MKFQNEPIKENPLKKILILFLTLFIISACSTNETTAVIDNSEGEMHPSITEKPEKGDLFMVENDSSESIIYAYIEKDSEVSLNEEDDTLEIHFDEPGESEDIALQTIEFKKDSKIDTLTFYINGVGTPLKSVIHEQ